MLPTLLVLVDIAILVVVLMILNFIIYGHWETPDISQLALALGVHTLLEVKKSRKAKYRE